MSDYTAAETFDSETILEAAMNVIRARLDDAEVHVSVEYDRKGERTTGAMNSKSPYRGYDEYLVNIQVRVTDTYEDDFKNLEFIVLAELDERDEAARLAAIEAKQVEIAALTAQQEALQAQIVALQK